MKITVEMSEVVQARRVVASKLKSFDSALAARNVSASRDAAEELQHAAFDLKNLFDKTGEK